MVHIVVTQEAKDATADHIWSKLAQYSDFSWHPEIKSSKDVGTIQDGSDNMVGAVRSITVNIGKTLTETVTEWDNEAKSFTMSIDEGGPPFAKKLMMGFHVREEAGKVFVDGIIDIDFEVAVHYSHSVAVCGAPQANPSLARWDRCPEDSPVDRSRVLSDELSRKQYRDGAGFHHASSKHVNVVRRSTFIDGGFHERAQEVGL